MRMPACAGKQKMHITSDANPQIRQIIQLNTKARARRETGLFTAEGIRLVREVPRGLLAGIYAAESLAETQAAPLREAFPELFTTVSDRLFGKISDTKTPQGVLAVVRMPGWEIKDLLAVPDPLIMILEDLQDPGNVGTVVRTCEAAGAAGVLISSHTADPYQPKAVRSAMGSLFRMPVVQAQNLPDAVTGLQDAGISVYAAHLEGSILYTQPDYRKGSAMMIGNEGNGLTSEMTALADVRIRIPMSGKVESLNASAAASVLLYEARRQRSADA